MVGYFTAPASSQTMERGGDDPQQQQQSGHSISSSSPSCPCKRVPLYLSSFTAAEHGNVRALVARQRDNDNHDWTQRLDSAGNTPLHLAAQHGHTAVTAFLLHRTTTTTTNRMTTSEPPPSRAVNVNAAAGGATPLHRAAYAGAVATMRLLLAVPECDLLARDTSFGDLQTPLHKACSGGRYLAVQLLLEALSLRSTTTTTTTTPTTQEGRALVEQALQMRDAAGLTPLQVARQKQGSEEEERRSVERWDSVAGGFADWEKCIRLLEARQDEIAATAAMATTIKSPSEQYAEAIEQRSLPEHLQRWSQQQQQQMDCGCEDENGQCLTASWERAFRAALQTTVDSTISRRSPAAIARNATSCVNEISVDEADHGPAENSTAESTAASMTNGNSLCDQQYSGHRSESQSKNSQQTTAPPVAGLQCSSCARLSIVLYSSEGLLICKKCRQNQRLARRVVRG